MKYRKKSDQILMGNDKMEMEAKPRGRLVSKLRERNRTRMFYSNEPNYTKVGGFSFWMEGR
jgi:hypothetical protein